MKIFSEQRIFFYEWKIHIVNENQEKKIFFLYEKKVHIYPHANEVKNRARIFFSSSSSSSSSSFTFSFSFRTIHLGNKFLFSQVLWYFRSTLVIYIFRNNKLTHKVMEKKNNQLNICISHKWVKPTNNKKNPMNMKSFEYVHNIHNIYTTMYMYVYEPPS